MSEYTTKDIGVLWWVEKFLDPILNHDDYHISHYAEVVKNCLCNNPTVDDVAMKLRKENRFSDTPDHFMINLLFVIMRGNPANEKEVSGIRLEYLYGAIQPIHFSQLHLGVEKPRDCESKYLVTVRRDGVDTTYYATIYPYSHFVDEKFQHLCNQALIWLMEYPTAKHFLDGIKNYVVNDNCGDGEGKKAIRQLKELFGIVT